MNKVTSHKTPVTSRKTQVSGLKLVSCVLCLVTFLCLVSFLCFLSFCYCSEPELVWPQAPSEARIVFVRSIYSASDVGLKESFWGKLKKVIVGSGFESGNLIKPVAVAVDTDKTLYICDNASGVLRIFSEKNKQSKLIISAGKEEFASIVAVAVTDSGMIFIADAELQKIFCFDKNLKLKFAIGSDKKLLRPAGLAIAQDKLYVADSAAHSILIFDLNGNFISSFGKRGKLEGEFNYPVSVALDQAGKIYVVDALNFRIQVFSKDYKFLYSIGQAGDSSGSFSRPKAVVLDSFGHIYVADGLFDNVQVFDQDKRFLLGFGNAGQKDGEFWIPSGMAVDNQDYIYVADAYNRRVQVFRYVGKE